MLNAVYEFIDEILKNSYCSFKNEFSLYCPACGMTRALKYAAKLDFINSLKSNPMVLLIILDIVIIILLFVLRIKYSKIKISKIILLINILTLSTWVTFADVRNCLLFYCDIDFLGDIANHYI